MPDPVYYLRPAGCRLAEALEDSPVVLLHGPRQSGKTTLAQLTCAPSDLRRDGSRRDASGTVGLPPGSHLQTKDYRYFSLDDPVARDGARDDPMGFVDDLPERVILDEIQRFPQLFDAIKIAVDRSETPRRFLLTGSSNVYLDPRMSDSLAGRMETVRLHPMSQYELERPCAPGHQSAETSHQDAGFLSALFGDGFLVDRYERLGTRLTEIMVAGGYPAALERPTARRRSNWYRAYVESLVRRDVRDTSRIRSLDVVPRLLRVAATQTAQLVNLSRLASPFELSRPAIEHYVTLLERLFLLERLPSWHSSHLKRLIKRPKLHLTDTGLAAALLGANARTLAEDKVLARHLLETFVFQELRRQASWHEAPTELFHFREKDGAKVDVVIEQRSSAIAGVEIKAGATVRQADFRGLRKLKKAAGDRFTRGVVLYDGEVCVPFGERLHAVPIARLWRRTP